jgi:hypothetical protein
MSWVHRSMIVPLANVDLARSMTAGLAGPSGTNMFTTPLSASGALPASHFISAGLIQDTFAALLTDANATFAACQQAGLAVTLAQIQALLAASTIDAGEPFAVMARLGLQMIQGAI